MISIQKPLLQEYSLKYFKMIPVYSVEEKSGPDHDPQFRVNVSINSQDYAFGEGSSTESSRRSSKKSFKNNGV